MEICLFLFLFLLITSQSSFLCISQEFQTLMYERNLKCPPLRAIQTLSRSTQENHYNIPDNNTWDDFALDQDKDGLFETLNINLGVIQSTPEYNYVYGVLKDMYGNPLGFSEEYISDREHVIILVFPGEPIYSSGVDGPYKLSVGLSYIYWWYRSKITFVQDYITASYNYIDFQRPAAEISNFSDYLLDEDGDSHPDEIIFEMDIEAKDPGYYDFSLYLGNTTPYDQIYELSRTESAYLHIGENQIEIGFSINDLLVRQLTSPFNIDLAIIKKNDREQQILSDPYRTDEYIQLTFSQPFVITTGHFWDRGIDRNNDSLFEEIALDIEVSVRNASFFNIEASLTPEEVQESYWDEYTSVNNWINEGVTNVTVFFNASSFHSLPSTSVFKITEIRISDLSGRIHVIINNPFLTKIYNNTDFPNPNAIITGRNFYNFHDENLDSFIDTLAILIEVNVTVPGLYSLEANLIPNHQNFSTYSYYDGRAQNLGIGLNNFSLSYYAAEYFIFRPSISFNITNIILRNSDYQLEDVTFLPITTSEIDLSIIPLPIAYFTGFYNVIELDESGNGFFDILLFNIELNVTQSGIYRIRIGYYSLDPNQLFSEYKEVEYSLSARKNVITFSVKMDFLYATKVPTALCWEYLNLYDGDWNNLDFRLNVFKTPEFHFSDWDPPEAFLTDKIEDLGFDSDDDGKFNSLQINLEINVTHSGYFSFDANLESLRPCDYGDSWSFTENYYSIGVHNVSLLFYVTLPWSLRLDTAWKFQNLYIRFEDNNENLRYLEFYITRKYNYNEFDAPAGYFTGNYWDNGEDNDDDGQFNRLNITIEVNVTDSGYYHLSYYYYAPGFDFGESGDHAEYWNIGKQSFTCYVPTGYLYTVLEDSSFQIKISYLEIRDNEGRILDRFYEDISSEYYTAMDLDPPGIYPNGDFSEEAFDPDKDGRFELIRFSIILAITETGWYYPSVQFNIDVYVGIYKSLSLSTYRFWDFTGQATLHFNITSSDIFSIYDPESYFRVVLSNIEIQDDSTEVIYTHDFYFYSIEYHTSNFDFEIESTTTVLPSIPPPPNSFGIAFFSFLILLIALFQQERKQKT